jgi:hypothetical protein
VGFGGSFWREGGNEDLTCAAIGGGRLGTAASGRSCVLATRAVKEGALGLAGRPVLARKFGRRQKRCRRRQGERACVLLVS